MARNLICVAFARRTLPSVLTDSKQLSDFEYEEVMAFQGVRWQDVTFAQIEKWPVPSSGLRLRRSVTTCLEY